MSSTPFAFEKQGNILIIVPSGSMMEYRDEDLRTAYNETYRRLCQDDTLHLLVDFSQLEYFGSTFIGMLIRLAKAARKAGGEAVLCDLSDGMKEMMKTLMLLENTKTDFFWVPFPDRAAAVDSLENKKQPTEPASPDGTPEAASANEQSSGWGRYM